MDFNYGPRMNPNEFEPLFETSIHELQKINIIIADNWIHLENSKFKAEIGRFGEHLLILSPESWIHNVCHILQRITGPRVLLRKRQKASCWSPLCSGISNVPCFFIFYHSSKNIV